MPPWILAHGSAGLTGDGVPVAVVYALVVLGAGLALVGLRARGPVPVGGPAVAPLALDGAEAGPWPGDGAPRAARVALQGVGVAVLVALLVVGWLGDEQVGANPLTLLVLAVGWWAVPALSWLLGDWWRLVDPFDALAAGLDRLRGRPAPGPGGLVDPDDDEPGDWWVPGLLLAAFAWFTTCVPGGRAFQPRWMAGGLTALTVVMVAGALLGGRAWVRRSSPLAVLCGTVAAAAPVAWERGRPRLRSPFAGLAARAGGRRSLAALVVVLGASGWEALSSSQWWADLAGLDSDASTVAWSTVGLAWTVLLVAGAWAGTARLVEALVARRPGPALVEPLAADLAAGLGPLVVAAIVGHQLSRLVDDLRTLPTLVLDPFSRGWDPIGAYSWDLSAQPLSPTTLGWVQVAVLAVAVGTTVVAGWDRVAARAGAAVLDAAWPLAGWAAGSGALAVWLLLGA